MKRLGDLVHLPHRPRTVVVKRPLTCDHRVGRDGPFTVACGQPAVWRVWFEDRTTQNVCEKHLPDPMDPEVRGATAL